MKNLFVSRFICESPRLGQKVYELSDKWMLSGSSMIRQRYHVKQSHSLHELLSEKVVVSDR
jgi:hypothetical protein